MKKFSDETVENILLGSAILLCLGTVAFTIYTFIVGC